MIILRQSQFSKSGEIWAGTKEALKKGGKWGFYGAVLMPGKIPAINKDKYKLALGLAGAGAVIGGTLGAVSGYKKGVDKYKYVHDPEYRAKVDKERQEEFEKTLKLFKEKDSKSISEFDYSSWLKLSKTLDIPQDFLKYVKFYENTWAKKLDPWYASTDKKRIDEVRRIPRFIDYFPTPISAKLCEEWFGYEVRDELSDYYLATVSDSGDDNYLVYNPEYKVYDFDVTDGKGEKSLKKTIYDFLKYLEHDEDNKLSKTQRQIIKEFKSGISFLS